MPLTAIRNDADCGRVSRSGLRATEGRLATAVGATFTVRARRRKVPLSPPCVTIGPWLRTNRKSAGVVVVDHLRDVNPCQPCEGSVQLRCRG